MNQKPDAYKSSPTVSCWNNVERPAGEDRLPMSGQVGHPHCSPPQPQPQIVQIQPYVSPNLIADFFCAPSHSTAWPCIYRG